VEKFTTQEQVGKPRTVLVEKQIGRKVSKVRAS
jgi:hypothetical protein